MTRITLISLFLIATSATAQAPTAADQILEMYNSRFEGFQTAATAEAKADAYVADIVDGLGR
jgi:hypothetical protein